MDKKALRALIREKKRAMTPEEIRDKSAALGRLLAQTSVYQAAKAVYGYYPQNQEVRLLPILEAARALSLRHGPDADGPGLRGHPRTGGGGDCRGQNRPSDFARPGFRPGGPPPGLRRRLL